MKASDLDKRFNAGEDVGADFDWSTAGRPNRVAKRVNVDFPTWMVRSLDQEARKLGVRRQSLIKMWLADKLEHRSGAA